MDNGVEANESIPKILDGNFFSIHSKDDKGSVKAKCERCPQRKIISGNIKGIGNFKLHLQVCLERFSWFFKNINIYLNFKKKKKNESF